MQQAQSEEGVERGKLFRFLFCNFLLVFFCIILISPPGGAKEQPVRAPWVRVPVGPGPRGAGR